MKFLTPFLYTIKDNRSKFGYFVLLNFVRPLKLFPIYSLSVWRCCFGRVDLFALVKGSKC